MALMKMKAVLCVATALLAACVSGQYSWEEKWFDGMPVDHFSYANNDSFSVRYLVNKTHWKQPNGPILFYCGNEGDIELFAENTGFMWDLAPRLRAMVIFVEHRYYGKTMPYGKKSFDSPKYSGYLSSEQALADFAVFIHWFKNEGQPQSSDSPIVAFGGSYGGMLAAWFRQKYPNLVVGAIAASAPVLQFTGVTPCYSYSEIVTRTFRDSGEGCDKAIKASWPVFDKYAKTDEGRKYLNERFSLCSNSTIKTEEDIGSLTSWLSNAWEELPMIDYPYPANFLNPLPGWPVKATCERLAKVNVDDDKELMTGIYSASQVFYNYTGAHDCFDLNGGSDEGLGLNGWSFQTCTEMVMPMCNNGTDMLIEEKWDFEEFADSCVKNYGVRPRKNWATTVYWGRQINAASNIVFSNGYLDPWSGGGILELPDKAKENDLHTIFLKQGAHHYDLRGANDLDTQEVKDVRKFEEKMVRKWIGQHYRKNRQFTELDILCLEDDCWN